MSASNLERLFFAALPAANSSAHFCKRPLIEMPEVMLIFLFSVQNSPILASMRVIESNHQRSFSSYLRLHCSQHFHDLPGCQSRCSRQSDLQLGFPQGTTSTWAFCHSAGPASIAAKPQRGQITAQTTASDVENAAGPSQQLLGQSKGLSGGSASAALPHLSATWGLCYKLKEIEILFNSIQFNSKFLLDVVKSTFILFCAM